MPPIYRCPVDDCVFTPSKEDRVPTLEGHPECPGPVCQENFAGYFSGTKPKSEQAIKPAAAAPAATVSPLAPPPIGQGW